MLSAINYAVKLLSIVQKISYLKVRLCVSVTMQSLFFIANQRLNRRLKLQMLLIYSFRALNVSKLSEIFIAAILY